MKNEPATRQKGVILGAAFLMATSAIGPGFLNNTSLFTGQLLSSFGFIILLSILIDIGAQLNIWRIIAVGEKRAQDLANEVLPGMGYVLAALVAFGGLAFNVGNIAGCGMGWEVLTGMNSRYGALISAAIALGLFWYREAGRAIDLFVKALGLAMIGFTLYVMFVSRPSYATALQHTFWPERIDVKMIVALVGGTVGGYISFAGAHRLLDAGISGRKAIPEVTRSSVTGILITSLMRYILFLAALGVVEAGAGLAAGNPAADVFHRAAGNLGYSFFGIVLWSAAITSVIGASYTSVSFWRSFHPALERNQRWLVTAFIFLSTVIFISLKQTPGAILVLAGVVNGLILPIALAMMLVVVHNRKLFSGYRHPLFLQIAGWLVVALMGWLSVLTIKQSLGK